MKVIILRDKKHLQSLVGFIESERTIDQHCGSDGSLHFFKENIVIEDVSFRMNESNCMQFSFLLNGKLFNTRLSPEAKEFLEALNRK